MRGWLRRVENAARGNLASFELLGGGRYYYDPASTELILHIFDCLHAQGDGVPFPEPPEVVRAIARARDREAALQQVTGDGGDMGLFPYETEALIERGEIVPRSLVEGRELGEGPLPDLSE